MKTIRRGICIIALAALSAGFLVSDLKAAGPMTFQQSVTQVQKSLTEASIGCRRCYYRRCCGYGWGGGWYGSSYGNYGGYGGYWGWGYSRPYVYSYPTYSNCYYSRPAYYTGYYGYSTPLTSCNCGGYATSVYQPNVYTGSTYAYPSQTIVYSSPSYATPSYTVGTVYGAPASTYTAPVYTPTYTSPTPISSPTPITSPSISTPSTAAPTPAPYPAPPVEYAQPSAYRAPIATLPMQTASTTAPLISTPAYNPAFAMSNSGHAAYGPMTYTYLTSNTVVNRFYSGSAW